MNDRTAKTIRTGSGPVAWLVPRDRLPRDEEQRARLAGQRGKAALALTLAQAREELAFRLAAIDLAANASDFAEVASCARRLRRLGAEVGFPTLTNAADNVLNSLSGFDAAALGATVARLQRLGVMAINDLSHLDP